MKTSDRLTRIEEDLIMLISAIPDMDRIVKLLNELKDKKTDYEKFKDIMEQTGTLVWKSEPKKPTTSIKAGYGYYFIDLVTLIETGDQYWDNIENRWVNITMCDSKRRMDHWPNSAVPPYRRAIPIPEGWELVPETEVIKENNQVWVKDWKVFAPSLNSFGASCSAYQAVIRKKQEIEVGEGYRLLAKEEPVLYGDDASNDNGQPWDSLTPSGNRVVDSEHREGAMYRRRVKPIPDAPAGFYIETDPEYVVQGIDKITPIHSLVPVIWVPCKDTIGTRIFQLENRWLVARPIKKEPTIDEMNAEIYHFFYPTDKYPLLNAYPKYNSSWDLMIEIIGKIAITEPIDLEENRRLSTVIFLEKEQAHKGIYRTILNLQKPKQ